MLTDQTIEKAKPQDTPFVLWDDKVKGLGVRVYRKGRKSYIIMYRVGATLKFATLARVEDVTLRDARKRAALELAKVRLGQEDLATRRDEQRNAPTLGDLWNQYETEFAPEQIELKRLTNKTLKDYRNILKARVLPELGKLKVKDIKRADIERVARKMIKRPTLRNRALAVLSRLFNLAEVWEMRPQHSNPVKGIQRTRESARDRVLSPDEMQRLNNALMKLEGDHLYEVRAIVTAALTGLRISEALSLQWENVNLETGRAVLPETKTGRRLLVLAGAVRALLANLPRIDGSPWVFPSSRPNVKATYYQTRHVFRWACENAGLSDCRLHDLRRSLATSLAGAGVNAYTLRDTLGHKTLEMSNRYVRQASNALVDASELAAQITSRALTGKNTAHARMV